MKRVIRLTEKSKLRKGTKKDIMKLDEFRGMGVDAKIELIRELIPLGLMYVEQTLLDEVDERVGPRYTREGTPGLDRWGSQKGHAYVLDQRYSIQVPRVRDTIRGEEVPLESYAKFKQPSHVDEQVFARVLRGVSCRDYKECAVSLPGALGLSSSTVSRRYIEASEKRLKELRERRLEKYDFIALLVDGKAIAGDEMLITLGITIEGKKVILGIAQSASENARVLKQHFEDLIERGLDFSKGLLIIIDGSKGIRKAIHDTFGHKAVVQRCQWHKRENVVAYLPDDRKSSFRRKLQTAYRKTSYEEASRALQVVKKELRLVNESAVASLEEGFEETLTLHRLGLVEEMGRSYATTNMLESINAFVEQRTQRVDHWVNSNQKHRWYASALLMAEPRLRKANGYRYLPLLRKAIQREIVKNERKEALVA